MGDDLLCQVTISILQPSALPVKPSGRGHSLPGLPVHRWLHLIKGIIPDKYHKAFACIHLTSLLLFKHSPNDCAFYPAEDREKPMGRRDAVFVLPVVSSLGVK
jgi:hypothetical protein